MLQTILVIEQYEYCPEFLGNTRITRFNRAIRVLPGIFGQYAIYPFQDGNTSIAQNFWAIRVLPGFEGRAIPVLPDSFKSAL